MKNLQLITLALAFFLSLMLSDVTAQNSSLARISENKFKSVLPKIRVSDDGNVLVYIFNPNRKDISVSFQDEGGNTLHREKTAATYYGKLLNVSQLETGEYALTLNSDAVSARYVVKIGSDVRKVNVKQVAVF